MIKFLKHLMRVFFDQNYCINCKYYKEETCKISYGTNRMCTHPEVGEFISSRVDIVTGKKSPSKKITTFRCSRARGKSYSNVYTCGKRGWYFKPKENPKE